MHSGDDVENDAEASSPRRDLERVATGTTVLLTGTVCGRGLQLVKQLLMARLLGPELLGVYAYLWNLMNLLSLVSPLGFQQGVIRFGTKFWRRDAEAFESVVISSLVFGLLSSVLCMAGVMIAAPWLAVTLWHDPSLAGPVRWFSLILPFSAILRIAIAATRITQRMKFGVYADEMARGVLNLGVFIVLFLAGFRLFGAILASLVSFIGAAILALYYVYKLFPELSWRRLRAGGKVKLGAMATFSMATATSAVFTNIINRSDHLMLGYFRDASEVGIYHVAAQLPFVLTIIMGGLNMAFMPIIAQYHNRAAFRELHELFRVTTKWRLYFSLPFVLVMCCIPGILLSQIFGQEYGGGATAMTLLALGQLVNAGTGCVGVMLIMSGRQHWWLGLSLLTMVANVLLHMYFIPRLGMAGAALTVLLTLGVLYGLSLLVLRWKSGLWPYDRRYWKGLLAAAIAALGAWGLKEGMDMTGWPAIFAFAILVPGSFFTVLLGLGLDAEDRQVMSLLKTRLQAATVRAKEQKSD